jgi:hypothetical protein
MEVLIYKWPINRVTEAFNQDDQGTAKPPIADEGRHQPTLVVKIISADDDEYGVGKVALRQLNITWEFLSNGLSRRHEDLSRAGDLSPS